MTVPPYRPVALIPVYDHDACLEAIVGHLAGAGLEVILVDDGSHEACARVLDSVARRWTDRGVRLVRRNLNGGKGAAVITGLEAAARAGFTHALQIDADGQHGLEAVPEFLAASRARPAALVCGHPVYDGTVPAARLRGRAIGNFWVRVNSLSPAVKDSMCGFRVYPVGTMMRLLAHCRPGLRMDFDCEVLVRLLWEDIPVVNRPVRVTYPAGGVSHFRAFRDNAAISWMHTRLFFGMLVRLPRLLKRKNV